MGARGAVYFVCLSPDRTELILTYGGLASLAFGAAFACTHNLVGSSCGLVCWSVTPHVLRTDSGGREHPVCHGIPGSRILQWAATYSLMTEQRRKGPSTTSRAAPPAPDQPAQAARPSGERTAASGATITLICVTSDAWRVICRCVPSMRVEELLVRL